MLIKPKKPTPDFPLFPHAPGQWAKMIKGRLHYFGPCKDAEGSLAGFQAKNEDSSSNKIPSNPKPRKPARTSRSCPCLRAVGKKVCGRLVYFGPWNDPQSAVNKWLDEKEDLLAGRLVINCGLGNNDCAKLTTAIASSSLVLACLGNRRPKRTAHQQRDGEDSEESEASPAGPRRLRRAAQLRSTKC
jgi:hypothetical protein